MRLLEEQLPLRDVSQQELNGDPQLLDGLTEPDSRGGGLPAGLGQVLLSLRVVQLDGLNPAQIVEVASALAVAGALGEGCLQDQFVSLVV